MSTRNFRLLMIIALLGALTISCTGCKMKQLGSTDFGMKVTHLPDPFGGPSDKESDIVQPGQLVFYPPWVTIYTMDTQLQSYTWAGLGKGDTPNTDERINTRASDGNEVHLGMTVQYHLMPTKIHDFLWLLGQGDKEAKEAVQNWCRSHIRTYLGLLQTEQFYDNTQRYEKCDLAKASLNRELEFFGVHIDKVIFDEHTFAPKYQELIDKAKQAEQNAQGKANEVKTKEADWKMQFQKACGDFNQLVAEANGRKRQKIATADAYFTAKENDSKAVMAAGEAEVAGIQKQITALRQPGGENIVRLEYGKALLESPARFIVLPGNGNGNGSGFNLTTTNNNDLLKTMGMLSLAPKPQPSPETPAQK